MSASKSETEVCKRE